MSHTPGPWFASPVQEADDGWTFVTVGPFDVRGKTLEHHVEDTIAEVSGINYAHELEGNANLIAAAPDLLKALKAVQAYGESSEADCVDFPSQIVDAAIAKAEG